MEVHHHPQVEKKNFKEYFLEFLMIFLAVTLGFFAENFREHRVEKERARKYIQSFYNDLKTDSGTFSHLIRRYQSSIRALEHRGECYDAINKNIKSDECLINLFNNSRSFADLINADQTLQQLKNAGNLRLLNQDDADSILLYDKMIRTYLKEETTSFQENQYKIRSMIYLLWNYQARNQQNAAIKMPVLLSGNRNLLNQYFNSLDEYSDTSIRLLDQLVSLKHKAADLIEYFKRRYELS